VICKEGDTEKQGRIGFFSLLLLKNELMWMFGTKDNNTNISSWSRFPLEKLIVAQLVKKIPRYCGSQRFITVFTRGHNWSLS
jgi:hypothetical protein